MERNKLYVILIIIFVLGMGFTAFNKVFNRDRVRPLLVEITQTQETQIAMSKLVQNNTANFQLQILAANTAATATSDNLTLKEYYTAVYGKKIPSLIDPIIEQLEDTTVGFDDRYRFGLKDYLEKNLNNLRQAHTLTQNENLKTILETAISNQEAHLSHLKSSQ